MVNSVQVEALQVTRGGREVLRDVSFNVPAGGVYGLLGPSGSGKTTLMRCLVGVQRGVRGNLLVLGAPAGSPLLRARVGYVTQSPSVYRDLTVTENLRYFRGVLGCAAGRVAEAISAVSLTDHEHSRVDRLSSGQQARVSLATALLAQPELLVLDEPTVGLDPVLREDLWALFHDLAASGTTLLVSSHVMNEAERCERLLLLRDGKLLADESPASLRRRTRTDTMDAAFLELVHHGAKAS